MLLCLITGSAQRLSTTDVLRPATMSDKQTLKDVDHTPPSGESVANVWERGTESAD